MEGEGGGRVRDVHLVIFHCMCMLTQYVHGQACIWL